MCDHIPQMLEQGFPWKPLTISESLAQHYDYKIVCLNWRDFTLVVGTKTRFYISNITKKSDLKVKTVLRLHQKA